MRHTGLRRFPTRRLLFSIPWSHCFPKPHGAFFMMAAKRRMYTDNRRERGKTPAIPKIDVIALHTRSVKILEKDNSFAAFNALHSISPCVLR